MAVPIYPALPGLTHEIIKAPRFGVRTQKAVSGRELKVLDQISPTWVFTLNYSILRDGGETRGGRGLGTGFDELRTIVGFYLQRQGSFDPFLFEDPTDSSIVGQEIGLADGTSTVYQLVRALGGYTEVIKAPKAISAIYFDGVLQSPFTYYVNNNNGLVTFNTAIPFLTRITADFTYYFRVRFLDDSVDFEHFLYQLWELKQVKLQSVLDGMSAMIPNGLSWEYIDLPPSAATMVLRHTVGVPFTLPASFAGSIATSLTPAAAQTIFDVAKNGVVFGNFTFNAGQSTATFSAALETTYIFGDVITIAPRTSDATLSGLSGVFAILV